MRLTQEDLAAMIGARRPTIRCLLTMFERQGLVTRCGRYIVILDPDAPQRRIVS